MDRHWRAAVVSCCGATLGEVVAYPHPVVTAAGQVPDACVAGTATRARGDVPSWAVVATGCPVGGTVPELSLLANIQ